MQDINEIQGKVAIVTGAASGIGRAITELLVARGAYVVAEDIDPAVEALAGPNVAPLVPISARTAARKKRWRLPLSGFRGWICW